MTKTKQNQIKTYKSAELLLAAAFLLVAGLPGIGLASEITTQKVIELVNAERRVQGLSELKENGLLTAAASAKAQDMQSKLYFAHTSPENVQPWYWFEQAGYDYRFAGENLALGFASAEKQEQAWMASPTHRKNLLNPKFEEIGIAITKYAAPEGEQTLVVQLFGCQMQSDCEKTPTVLGLTETKELKELDFVGENRTTNGLLMWEILLGIILASLLVDLTYIYRKEHGKILLLHGYKK